MSKIFNFSAKTDSSYIVILYEGMAPGMQQGPGIHQSPGQPADQNMGAPPPTSQDENSLIVW